MIGNSLPEYVFIRASIIALRLIAPTSIVYLAASAYARTFLFSPILAVFAIAEAGFYALVYVPRKYRLQQPPTYRPPPLTRSEREALFKKCCADLDILHDTPYPKGWFLPRRTSLEFKLRRQDVVDWLLWALFSCRDVEEEWRDELDTYVEAVEGMLGETLDDEACTSDVRSMRLTVDPVKIVHRPLVWYLIVCLVDTITSLNLLSLGFQHYSSLKWFEAFPPRPILSLVSKKADISPDILLPYWYRPHKSSTKLPIMFVHGIGIGLHPYVPFIRDLTVLDPDVGILLVELLPISMHMTSHPVPPAPLLASALNNILETLNIPRVVLAAHSYGTFVATCILHDPCSTHSIFPSDSPVSHTPNRHPLLSKLAHTILIDPIPLLLHLPPVAHNFLYRSPSAAAEWQLWYFASTDPDVARTLGRAFFWTEGATWAEDVQRWMRAEDEENNDDAIRRGTAQGSPPNNSPEARRGGGSRKGGRHVAVVLAGNDQIIPAEKIRRYLTGLPEASARWVGRGWADWELADGTSETPGTGSGKCVSGGAAVDIGVARGDPDVVEIQAGRTGGGGDLEVLFYPGLDHATVFDTQDRREAMLEVLERFTMDT